MTHQPRFKNYQLILSILVVLNQEEEQGGEMS